MRFVVAAVVSLVSAALFAATLGSASLQGAMFVDVQTVGLCETRVAGLSDALKAQGLRSGDVIQLDRMNAESRMRLTYPARAGQSTTWAILRGGRQIDLKLTFESLGN